jgi:hypothetical protein
MKNLIINIPFAGFYETRWNDGLDRVEEYTVENLEEEHKTGIIADLIWQCANYYKSYQHVAEEFVDYFNDYIKEEYELDLDLKFESMTSPRDYNFDTDRIFCFISEENVRKLRAAVSEPPLRQVIRERFTSRSGFISSYTNRLEDWDADPTTWDHYQLGTLLVALLADAEDYEWEIWERMSDRNVFDSAFDNCVDWEKFDELLKEQVK